MRDLVALSALPAVWAGYEPRQVAEGLADVLLSTLGLAWFISACPGRQRVRRSKSRAPLGCRPHKTERGT
jgi:hypothetical protein